MENRFKVVYTGELQPYVSAQEAIRNVAALFKVSEDRIRALVLGGQARTIKVNLDNVTAARYVSALSKAGLAVRVEPMTPQAPELHLAPATPLEPIEEVATDGDRCPKCGVTAVRDGVCGACGVVVAKYLARMTPDGASGAGPGMGPGVAARPGSRGSEQAGHYARMAKPGSEHASGSGSGSGHPGPAALMGPQGVPVGNGWSWIRRGFSHFTTSPGTWILIVLGYGFIVVALSLVPLLGGIAATLISPVLVGGLMMGAQDQALGRPLGFHHLFGGFSNRAGTLVTAGVLYLVGILLAAIPAMFLVGLPLYAQMGDMAGMDPSGLGQDPQLMAGALAGRGVLLDALVAAALMIPVAMAYWFAPALIALDGLGAWEAMKLSFRGCLKNILPFLLYGVLGLMLVLVGSLPLFLGLLVVLPTLVASMYVSYRDIFHGQG